MKRKLSPWLVALALAAGLTVPASAVLICTTVYDIYASGAPTQCHEECELYNPDGSFAGRIRFRCVFAN